MKINDHSTTFLSFLIIAIIGAVVLSTVPIGVFGQPSETVVITSENKPMEEYIIQSEPNQPLNKEKIDNLIEKTVTDKETLAKDNGLSDAELNKYQYAGLKIGEKQYILNSQLKQQLVVAKITSTAMITHLEKKGYDTNELENIQDKIIDIESNINTEEMTRGEFIAKLSEVKSLTKEFKEKVHELVKIEDLDELKSTAETEKKTNIEIMEMDKTASSLRNFYNSLQLNQALSKINNEIQELKENSTGYDIAMEKFVLLHQLKESYLESDSNKENIASFHEQWKVQFDSFKEKIYDIKTSNQNDDGRNIDNNNNITEIIIDNAKDSYEKLKNMAEETMNGKGGNSQNEN